MAPAHFQQLDLQMQQALAEWMQAQEPEPHAAGPWTGSGAMQCIWSVSGQLGSRQQFQCRLSNLHMKSCGWMPWHGKNNKWTGMHSILAVSMACAV